MSYGFKILVAGDYACFTRSEFKVERVSYDVPTPGALEGMLKSIYWKPSIRYVIDEIVVFNPIDFANIRRNEVKDTINARKVKTVMERGTGELYLATPECIQQRAAMVLRNVRYVIEAHFAMTEKAAPGDNPGKFQDIMKRRLERGQFYHQPCFGVREFPAHFRACREIPSCPEELKGEKDLGWMLLDLNFSNPESIEPQFFRAVLRDGVLEVPAANRQEVVR